MVRRALFTSKIRTVWPQDVFVSINLADALYNHVRVLDPTLDDSKPFFKPGEKWIFWIVNSVSIKMTILRKVAKSR